MRRKHKNNYFLRLNSKFPRATSELDRRDHFDEPAWRIFRIMSEFVEGFQFLSKCKQEVAFFGSARLGHSSKYYKEAVELGKILARRGYSIITGGGPGIMEAGNKGAILGNGESIGINIQLPFEQRVNRYVKKSIGFHYFFTRKVILSASAQAYVFFPGGLGTLDELFEMLTLIQTKKMEKIPVVLIGRDFWNPLINWMEMALVNKHKTISPGDLKIFQCVNSAPEAYAIIKKSKERNAF